MKADESRSRPTGVFMQASTRTADEKIEGRLVLITVRIMNT
jgi:hypothetical protein